MSEIITLLLITIYSALFGSTMKIADLLNEHGLKLFSGDKILFGIFWGIFGALFISANNAIANIILATVLGFIIRMKIDYLNHAIATCIIIISFLMTSTFNPIIFFPFFIVFVVFGPVRDYISKKIYLKKIEILIYYDFLYPVPAFFYSVITNDWITFYYIIIYALFYNIVRFYGKKYGYK